MNYFKKGVFMLTSYLVTLRQKRLDNQTYVMLLSRQDLADLLMNLDTENYEIGEIVNTLAEKVSDIKEFCKQDENLKTGE